MKNVGIALVIGASAILLIMSSVVRTRAVETISVPDTVTLSDYSRTEGPVTFLHKDHGNTGEKKPSCLDCHHTTPWDQTPEKCSACHKPLEASAAPTDIVAFHKLCIGCHKSEIERGNARLSLACESCHKTER